MLIDKRYSSIERFKFAIPRDMFEAVNIGMDFLAMLISDKCSSEKPVVPDIKGKLCSIQ